MGKRGAGSWFEEAMLAVGPAIRFYDALEALIRMVLKDCL